MVKHFYHSWIKILQNTKKSIKNLPKTFKIVPKWRNFAKSGHTGWIDVALSNVDGPKIVNKMFFQFKDVMKKFTEVNSNLVHTHFAFAKRQSNLVLPTLKVYFLSMPYQILASRYGERI